MASSTASGLSLPNAEDLYAHIGVKSGGVALDGEGKYGPNVPDPRKPWAEKAITFDLFAYHGITRLDNGTGVVAGGPATAVQQDDRFNAVGAVIHGQLDSLMLTAGVQMERHDRPYAGTGATAGPGGAVIPGVPDLTNATAILQYNELDYVVWPWFVPGVRTEFTTTSVEGSSDAQLLRVIPGVAMLARPNIKVVVTGDLEWGKNLPTVGSWAPAGGFVACDDRRQVRGGTNQRGRGRRLLEEKNHALKRILTLLLLTAAGPFALLSACEGEPPVMAPGNNMGVNPKELAPAEAPSEEPSAAPSMEAKVCPPPPCAPVAASALASASPAPSGSAAPEASSAAALPVPPPSIPRGNIVGAVTTQPPGLKGQAVVYLEDGPLEDQPGHLQTVTVSNRQMNFIPFVSVAAVGAKVVFANEDPFPHNVFSPDNEKFNMGNIPQHGAHVRVFHAPGAYTLLCNLHPGMLGYLLVTPSAWHVRTDSKGHFDLKHAVPSGTYKATAWAPRLTPVTQSVTVADGDVTVNFDLHR